MCRTDDINRHIFDVDLMDHTKLGRNYVTRTFFHSSIIDQKDRIEMSILMGRNFSREPLVFQQGNESTAHHALMIIYRVYKQNIIFKQWP